MANQFNSKTDSHIQTLVNAITTALGTSYTVPGNASPGVALDLSFAPGFQIVLEVDPDGRTLTLRTKSSDQGPNNAFGPVDSGGTHLTRVKPLVIDASQLP